MSIDGFADPGSLVLHPSTTSRGGAVAQLGANANGEILEPGRVTDCYLGLRLDPADEDEAAGVLVVAPAGLLHPVVPQPDGWLLYELLTGHPDQTPHELVFVADLTVSLRAWPTDTWTRLDVDPQAAAGAVIAAWRRGDLKSLRLAGLTAQEVTTGLASRWESDNDLQAGRVHPDRWNVAVFCMSSTVIPSLSYNMNST